VALLWPGSRLERAIDEGRLDEARTGVAELARRRGDRDAEVLWLRARLAQEQLRHGEGGSAREVFELLGKALGAGSGPAERELERQARSRDCQLRRLTARALADSRSRRALPLLRGLATAEPEPPRDPLSRVTSLLKGENRCGDGDIAREGIEGIEGTP